MVKIIEQETSIKIGKEPMVILPLKKWEVIGKTLKELEYALRFNIAYKDSRGQKSITLETLKKKYNLR